MKRLLKTIVLLFVLCLTLPVSTSVADTFTVLAKELTVPKEPYKIVNVVNGVHVYWNEVDGVEKYGVWRSETGKNGTYKWVANPTTFHFTDIKVESGKTYFYKVTSMDPVTGKHSDKSDPIGIIYVSTPDISKRENREEGIYLGWEAVDGAEGYGIYRKSFAGTDAWVRIGTVTDGLEYTDSTVAAKNGSEYRYTIRALAGFDLKTLSGCRNTGRSMVRLSSRTLTVLETGENSVKCSWDTTRYADGYEVQMVDESGNVKKFTVGNYKTGTKTFTSLEAETTYSVTIRSYKKLGDAGTYYSAWSKIKTAVTKEKQTPTPTSAPIVSVVDTPAKPYKIVNVVSGVHVYWKAVEGAQKYGVWRSETGMPGSYEWLGNPTKTDFTDTKVESGKVYSYKITAMASNGKHSNMSEAINIIYVATPDITVRENSKNGIYLSWNKVEGATGYAVYRKKYGGTDAWKRIATTEGNLLGNMWVDKDVVNKDGAVYQYTVRALTDSNKTTLSGCRSAGRTMVRLTDIQIENATAKDSTTITVKWTAAEDVTGYEINIKDVSGFEKTEIISDNLTTTVTFSDLEPGTDYALCMRKYKKVDGVGNFYSDWVETYVKTEKAEEMPDIAEERWTVVPEGTQELIASNGSRMVVRFDGNGYMDYQVFWNSFGSIENTLDIDFDGITYLYGRNVGLDEWEWIAMHAQTSNHYLYENATGGRFTYVLLESENSDGTVNLRLRAVPEGICREEWYDTDGVKTREKGYVDENNTLKYDYEYTEEGIPFYDRDYYYTEGVFSKYRVRRYDREGKLHSDEEFDVKATGNMAIDELYQINPEMAEKAWTIYNAIIKEDMTDYEKVLAIYDYAMAHIDVCSEYGIDVKGHLNKGDANFLEYALLWGVEGIYGNGYSSVINLLLSATGIEYKEVCTDYINEEGYFVQTPQWTMVKLDGNWYHIYCHSADEGWLKTKWENPIEIKLYGEYENQNVWYYTNFLATDEQLSNMKNWDRRVCTNGESCPVSAEEKYNGKLAHYCFRYDDAGNKLQYFQISEKGHLIDVASVMLPQNITLAKEMFDVEFYLEQYPYLEEEFGNDADKLFEHWLNVGIQTGLNAIPDFNPMEYLQLNPEVAEKVNYNVQEAIVHYIDYGVSAGLNGSGDNAESLTSMTILPEGRLVFVTPEGNSLCITFDENGKAVSQCGYDKLTGRADETYFDLWTLKNSAHQEIVYYKVREEDDNLGCAFLVDGKAGGFEYVDFLSVNEDGTVTISLEKIEDSYYWDETFYNSGTLKSRTDEKVNSYYKKKEYYENGVLKSNIDITYDDTGKNVYEESYKYNKDGQCTEYYTTEYENGVVVKESRYKGNGNLDFYTEYSYHENGVLKSKAMLIGADAKPQYRYGYDENGELISTDNYSYDGNGECWQRQVVEFENGKVVKEIKYDGNNLVEKWTSYTYHVNGKKKQVSEYIGEGENMVKSFHWYDEMGNLTKKNFYSYDYFGKLSSYNSTEYTYDNNILVSYTVIKYDQYGTVLSKVTYDANGNVM